MKLALAALILLAPAAFAAEAPAPAPTTLKATCVVFTWPDSGPGVNVLLSKDFVFEVNKRVELLRTDSAIYEAVVSSNLPNEVFLDVKTKEGNRIAGANGSIVLGASIAEPNVETQYNCIVAK